MRDSTEEAAAAAHSLWVVLFGPAHGQSGTARGLSSCGWGAFSLPAHPQRVSMSRMRRSRLFTSRAVIRVHGPTLDYGVVNGTVPQTWCGPARVRPLIGPRRTRAAVGIKCTPVCSRAAAERGAVDTCAPQGGRWRAPRGTQWVTAAGPRVARENIVSINNQLTRRRRSASVSHFDRPLLWTHCMRVARYKGGVSQAACGLFSYTGRSGAFAEMSSVKNYARDGDTR